VLSLPATDRNFLLAVSGLAHCNPFLPERLEFERQALGDQFSEVGRVWSRGDWDEKEPSNIEQIGRRVVKLATQLRDQLEKGQQANKEELLAYEDLVLYMLYYEVRDDLKNLILTESGGAKSTRRLGCWPDFLDKFHHYLRISSRRLPSDHDPAHLLAGFFQVRRAFHHIFDFIVGTSMPAAKLRAAVWQSIFTHDLRRYRRSLYKKMGDIATLIVGPSGTGKELVARAIGLSRYIPFDADSQTFRDDHAASFHPLNLSALSPTLIESELFGHCRGAYTGANEDRKGWLESCSPQGTVFLDEIGELDPIIQVKLLRVLQARTFQRLGESVERRFEGKVIAATNRDLAAEMDSGRFRADFYYRLCSDVITTPSLHEQLADSPEDLGRLIRFLAERIDPDEAGSIADEVEAWIVANMGNDYTWPGNIRELEQCVRNVVIRKSYQPPGTSSSALARFLRDIESGCLTAEEVTGRYCTLIYWRTGSYEQTAQRLGIDRRTVKAKVDAEWLDELDKHH